MATKVLTCCDCNQVIARYDDTDADATQRANNTPHNCKQQRARNRETQRALASKRVPVRS